MKKKRLLFTAGIIILSFMAVGLISTKITAQSGNLVANPSFESGGADIGQDYNQSGWTFFVIEEPVKGIVSGNAKDGNACFEIQTDGGRGFLHSDPFSVSPSSKLNISLWVKGSGEGAVEILWWKEYNNDVVIESGSHRKILKEFNASSAWNNITVTADAPDDAKYAYIRLVAKKENIAFDNISVTK